MSKGLAWDPFPSKCFTGKLSKVTVASSPPLCGLLANCMGSSACSVFLKISDLTSVSNIFIKIDAKATGLKLLTVLGLLDLGTGTTTASFQTSGTCCACRDFIEMLSKRHIIQSVTLISSYWEEGLFHILLFYVSVDYPQVYSSDPEFHY